MSDLPVTVIVLAAQRHGVANPLAVRAGVSHKCLVPICGEPLIMHVVRTISALPGVKRIRVSLEPEAHAECAAAIEPVVESSDVPIELVASRPNIVDSTIEAAHGEDGPFIVTTADNVLLTREGFDLIRNALRHADGVIGVTTRDRVWAVHRQGQRNFYEFRGGGHANCNIYGLANRAAFAGAEIFREGGQFQANVGRMIRAFGLWNIIAMRLGLITLDRAFTRVSKRFGIQIAPVVFEDGALAIDVDNERTYAICEWVLGQRLGMDVARPEIPADSK